MAGAADVTVKAAVSEISFRRSHQQGVIRAHINRVRSWMLSDRLCDIAQCEGQLIKLVSAREAYVAIDVELIAALDKYNIDPKDAKARAVSLYDDIKSCYDEAQEWIVGLRSRASRGELDDSTEEAEKSSEAGGSLGDVTVLQQPDTQSSPSGFFTPGAMAPSMIRRASDASDKGLLDRDDYETIIKDRESEVDRLSRQMTEMRMKLDTMQNAQYRASMLEEQLQRQQDDFDARERTHVDENRRLHHDLDVSREKERAARTSTPSGRGYTPVRAPAVAERSSFGQDDIFAISQAISGTNADMMKQLLDHSTRQNESFFSSMNVPVTPLQRFSGDSTKYYTFMKRFDEVVHNSHKNVASKLNTLIEHCEPEVRAHLDCCNYKDAHSGYALARSILKKRYGNPYQVSQAWVEKLMDFPKLRSAELIGRFSGELTSAYETLDTLGFLSELECTRSMRLLVSKLPSYVQNRWRRVHRESLDKDEPARLKELIKVVSEASLEMSDPVYGPESMGKLGSPDVKPKPGTVKKKVTINLAADGQKGSRSSVRAGVGSGVTRMARFPCLVCQDPRHYTYQCFVFKDYSPEERLTFVDEKRLCYLCLNASHMVSACDRTYTCQYPGCGARHNTTLHRALLARQSTTQVNDDDASALVTDLEDDGEELSGDDGCVEVDEDPEGLPVLLHETLPVYNGTRYHGNYVLPTLPVLCSTVHDKTASNALIDTGSTVTMCSVGLQQAMGAKPIARSEFLLQGINGDRIIQADVIEFSLQGTSSSEPCEALNVIVNPDMSISQKHARQLRRCQEWPHLKHLDIVHAPHDTVELLLGQDNAHLFKQYEYIDIKDTYSPYGVRTPLGWTVFGNLTDKIGRYQQACDIARCVAVASPGTTDVLLERMWEIDQVPIVDPMSPVNRGIIKMWNESFIMIDGHIHLPLPFKQDPPNLPNNRRPVLAQLNSLKRKFEKNAELHQKCCAAMNTNLERGFTEKVTARPRAGYENFVPQLPVITDRRPGKCRIVGNASFVFQNTSLNQALHQGPNLTGDLVEIMVDFRVCPVVLTADIEQMYNQVRVPENQRDALKVLWWPDGDFTQDVEEYQMTTQMFGLISSPAAAMHAMREGVRRYGDDMHPDTVVAALKNFYVDDLIKSIMNISVGIRLARELKMLLARIGFNLTKFGSNRLEILEAIDEKDRAAPYKALEFALSESATDKTLGSTWSPLKDVFLFIINLVTRPDTKRGMLSTFSSVFDPLGLVGPIILRARMIIQLVCRKKLEWDQDLTGEMQERWNEWKEDVVALSGFSVPRWLGITDEREQQCRVHVFADASELGYGAVAYMAVKDMESGDTTSKLIMSKARVAPLKQVSIPRLELSAAVLAVKLAKIIERGVQIPMCATMFWSDSTITLHCVLSQSRVFKTFVANRVAYVQEHTEASQWRYVPGAENIADVVSRGCCVEELRENKCWIDGPAFLQSEAMWPKMPDVLDRSMVEGMPEYRTNKCVMTRLAFQLPGRADLVDELMTHYSSWHRLIKAVGYWKKFVSLLRLGKKRFRAGLNAQEYKAAEETVVRCAQKELRDVDRFKDPTMKKLYTFDSDDIIRVGGRLMMANLEYEERYPAVLPPGRAAELYIRHKHHRLGHPGIDRTYMETRRRMWIITGKRYVKSVLEDCVMCQRLRSRAAEQQMAPLPRYRVDVDQAPFQKVGVDFFGPIYVRQGRATIKRYGCAITCLTSRAFHVEPVSDLSTSSFLQALQRFIARRGKPTLIVSDNGTNFVGAHRELKELMKKWNKNVVSDYLLEEGIEWRFNTPTASHHGGVWERQIRSVRVILMALVKNQVLTDETLHTYLCMVEQVINSRPLTKVTENPSDELPLTPQHFLTLHRATGIAGDFSSAESMRKKWKHVQKLSNEYWHKWSISYLRDLQVRTKWNVPHDNFKIGDLALYMKQDCSRLDWPLALITKIHRGIDGKVRTVTIKTKDGVYDRPITKLIRLECDE